MNRLTKRVFNQKTLPWITLICLIAFAAWAANPSFSDFNGSQFTTAGNVVTINHLSAGIVDSGTINVGQFPALTGDVTTPGGSFATTLATVNANVGTFGDSTHVGQFTVNGKGLITAASSVSITGGGGGGSATNAVTVGSTNGTSLGSTTVTNLNIGNDANGNIIVSGGTSGGGNIANLTNALSANLTAMSSISGSGAKIQMSGNPNGIGMTWSNNLVSGGGNFIWDTNATPGQKFGLFTNNYYSVIEAQAYGLTLSGDQSSAAQAAVNAATNLGQAVHFPAGTYIITNLVVKGVTLIGDTPGSSSGKGTIFTMGSGVGPIVYIPTNSLGTIIRGITFAGTGLAGTAITTATNDPNTDTTNFKIENCTFAPGVGVGIYLNRANVVSIDDCFFNNNKIGVWGTNNANAVAITRGHFFDITGIRIDDATCINWTLAYSRIENSSNGVVAVNMQLFNAFGNYLEANTNDFLMNGVQNANILDNNMSTSFLTTNVLFVGVNGGQIIGNRFGAATPSYNVDNTSFKVHIGFNSFNNPPSYKFNPITGKIDDGTNTTWSGGGGPVGNGVGLTNVTAALLSGYVYQTNSIGTTTLVLDTGVSYYSNMVANVTFSLTINSNNAYGSCVYWGTNTSGGNLTGTFPSGTRGPVGSGFPAVITFTNNTLTKVVVEHQGTFIVTATPVTYAN